MVAVSFTQGVKAQNVPTYVGAAQMASYAATTIAVKDDYISSTGNTPGRIEIFNPQMIPILNVTFPNSFGQATCWDANGNAYFAIGYYQSSSLILPDTTYGVTNSDPYSTYFNLAILKYSSNGIYIGSMNATTTGHLRCYTLAYANGMILVGGGASDSIFINGMDTITSYGAGTSNYSMDALLLAIDTSCTSVYWSNLLGNTQPDYIHSIATDGTSLIAAGEFWGSMQIGPQTLISMGYSDNFLATFDLITGTPSWALSIGGQSDFHKIACTVTSEGKIAVTGETHGSTANNHTILKNSDGTIFDSIYNVTSGQDFFVGVIDSDGFWIWDKYFWNTNSAIKSCCVIADDAGNIEIGGSFSETMYLDYPTNSQTMVSPFTGSTQMSFWIKLDPFGNLISNYTFGGGGTLLSIIREGPFIWLMFDMNSALLPDLADQNYPGCPILFASDGETAILKYYDPIPIPPPDEQEINLTSGWSLFSTYIDPIEPNMDSIASMLAANLYLIKDENGNVFWPTYGVNLIGNITTGKGYWIKMNTADTLVVTGELIPAETPIALAAGWSILGYLNSDSMEISLALASIETQIVLVKNGNGEVYWPAWSVNLIGNMQPGEGYQIKMSTPAVLIYPEIAVATKSSAQILKPVFYKNVKNTGTNMNLMIPIESWQDLPSFDSEVGVFSPSGILVGSGVFTGENLAITIWGNDKLTSEIDGIQVYEEFILKTWDGNEEQNLEITSWIEGDGNFEKNKIAVAGKIISDENSERITLSQNVPNPFSGETEIPFSLPASSEIELSISNILGKKLKIVKSGIVPSGTHFVTFNSNDFSPGMYFYKLSVGEKTFTKRMIVR